MKYFQVEFDNSFHGGDYAGVGEFVLVPFDLLESEGSPERAFTRFTGKDSRHIVHYTLDEVYDRDGNWIEE